MRLPTVLTATALAATACLVPIQPATASTCAYGRTAATLVFNLGEDDDNGHQAHQYVTPYLEEQRVCGGRFRSRVGITPGSRCWRIRAVTVDPSPWRGRNFAPRRLPCTSRGAVSAWTTPWRSSSLDRTFSATVVVDQAWAHDRHATLPGQRL